jgi:preprotein translocase subunit SecE
MKENDKQPPQMENKSEPTASSSNKKWIAVALITSVLYVAIEVGSSHTVVGFATLLAVVSMSIAPLLAFYIIARLISLAAQKPNRTKTTCIALTVILALAFFSKHFAGSD